MTQSNILEQAKQGNPGAIALILNQHLQPKGIKAKTNLNQKCLMVMVEAATLPEQAVVVDFIRNGLTNLKPAAIERVVVRGQSTTGSAKIWREAFDLTENSLSTAGVKPTRSIKEILKELFQHRSVERVSIVVATFFATSLMWFVAGKHNDLPVAQKEVAVVSSVTRSPSSSEEVKLKPLPVLGSEIAQLNFESEDAQAIVNGTERPTTPETLAVLAGNPPPGTDVCNLSFQALTMAVYDGCIREGMSYAEVVNVIGYLGTEKSSSGSTKEYEWLTRGGMMTANFENDILTSKSQEGLK